MSQIPWKQGDHVRVVGFGPERALLDHIVIQDQLSSGYAWVLIAEAKQDAVPFMCHISHISPPERLGDLSPDEIRERYRKYQSERNTHQ